MSEKKEELELGETGPPGLDLMTPNVVWLNSDAVLKIVDDWEQDYFVPVSWPSHVRDHVFAAVAVLKERIRGLAP